jgi:signal transduction histidine kinase
MSQKPEGVSEAGVTPGPDEEISNLRLELTRLRERLERERAIRRQSEALAEGAVRDLYDRQRALTLLQGSAAVANRASGVEQALQTTLNLVCEYTRWPVGHAYLLVGGDTGELVSTRVWHLEQPERFTSLRQVSEATRFQSGVGLPGRVLQSGEPAWIIDVSRDANFPRARMVTDLGVTAAFAFPVIAAGKVAAVVEFFSRHPAEPDERLLEIMRSVGEQLGRVIERTRAQEALQAQARELARSNEELQQFAYVASHDLQEPLRMVASYTQLLEKRYKDKLDTDALEFIHYAVDGARRMQALINDLLAYSRVGTRGKPFTTTDCNIVLKLVLTNLKMAIEESGATVRSEPLPSLVADSTQLVQLFQNLIGNAIKFRREDEPPTIQISARRAGEEWEFSFRDNGIGIDPQHWERIFVIFQRLHTRDKYPGTGIGLAVCRKIVERHGGRLWVESTPGAGSTFMFTLLDRQREEPL